MLRRLPGINILEVIYHALYNITRPGQARQVTSIWFRSKYTGRATATAKLADEPRNRQHGQDVPGYAVSHWPVLCE